MSPQPWSSAMQRMKFGRSVGPVGEAGFWSWAKSDDPAAHTANAQINGTGFTRRARRRAERKRSVRMDEGGDAVSSAELHRGDAGKNCGARKEGNPGCRIESSSQ